MIPFDLDYKKEYFDRYSQISIDALVASKNVEELVDNLAGTEYYEPLKKIREMETATLFDYDMALELYYFTTLWKRQKRLLKGKELKLYARDCGTKIDLLNLQWVYRAKKYWWKRPAWRNSCGRRRIPGMPGNMISGTAGLWSRSIRTA